MSYAFGYRGSDNKSGLPKYEMTSAIPEITLYYGLLSGAIFLVPFAVFGLFTGRLVDVVNSRIKLYGLVSILWSSPHFFKHLFQIFGISW